MQPPFKAVAFAALLGASTLPMTMAAAQTTTSAPAAPMKAVDLTPKMIDNFVDAKKDISPLEAKIPDSGEPDAKLKGDLDAAVKKHGFDNLDQYGDVEGAIVSVMDGIDPNTKAYVGTAAVIQKEITDVQADKTMSAKDKTDALDALNNAAKSVGDAKPPQGNIDLVTKNFDRLSPLLTQD